MVFSGSWKNRFRKYKTALARWARSPDRANPGRRKALALGCVIERRWPRGKRFLITFFGEQASG